MKRLSTNRKVLGFIDAWISGGICAILTALKKCGLFGRISETHRKGILFLKLAEQGSTVLAYQALKDATEQYGRENIYFLVFEENRFILDALNVIPPENVLPIHTKNAFSMAISGLRQLYRIRKLQLLACVDLEFFARSTAVIAFLTNIPRRVGFHGWFSEGPYRGDLFTHRLRYNPHIHTSIMFRCLVAAIEADAHALPRFDWIAENNLQQPPLFQPTAEESRRIHELLTVSTGAFPPVLILLNANASDLLPLRKWADANYVKLAQRILDEIPNTYIAFTGSHEEQDVIEYLAESVQRDRVFSTAGKTTLRELLALYGQADVLVTNDSGPAHFAALTPIHTVVLFGPETPKLFANLSPRNQSIFANLACSPCVSALNNRQTRCRNNVCMQRITVTQVFYAVEIALKERGKHSESGASFQLAKP